MEDTYQSLRQLAELYKENGTLHDAVEQYKLTKDPILISHVFCQFYAYIRTQSSKYFYLTSSDKASFAVEELDKAMNDFDPSYGVKLLTLFDRYYNNRLRSETQMLQHHKRCANNASINYEDWGESIVAHQADYLDVEFSVTITQGGELTENELKYCELIMDNGDKIRNTDIAYALGISSAAVTYIKRSLRNKLNSLIA